MNTGEKSKTYMYFLVIALIIPLVFVVVKEEVLNFAITSKEECEKISGLPVIGTIENISKKLAGGVVLVKNFPKSSFAESFRNMRVRIEYMAQRENKITVLVTSTEPADGKTFIATNVASVYQLMGKKEEYDYVIVDCSPVGLVSDAYILSSMADTTLFVVRRAKTNKAFFKSVITQLGADGVENIALVFNDVKGREGYYGTSRYYGDKTYYLKKNSYYHDDYFES